MEFNNLGISIFSSSITVWILLELSLEEKSLNNNLLFLAIIISVLFNICLLFWIESDEGFDFLIEEILSKDKFSLSSFELLAFSSLFLSSFKSSL